MEILRSAAECFRDRGFEAASMEEIGRGVGMTKGNLYYYFKSKKEILFFAQRMSLDRLLKVSARIGRLRANPAQKLHLLAEAHVRCLLAEMHAAAAHIEFHALPPVQLRRVIGQRDRYERRVRGMIEEGMREGLFNRGDSKLATFAVLGALNWAVRWYRPDGPWGVEDIAKGLARILVRGLLVRSRTYREASLGKVMA